MSALPACSSGGCVGSNGAECGAPRPAHTTHKPHPDQSPWPPTDCTPTQPHHGNRLRNKLTCRGFPLPREPTAWDSRTDLDQTNRILQATTPKARRSRSVADERGRKPERADKARSAVLTSVGRRPQRAVNRVSGPRSGPWSSRLRIRRCGKPCGDVCPQSRTRIFHRGRLRGCCLCRPAARCA